MSDGPGLTVYGRATSSNVQAVMWAIAELGLACRRLDFGGRYGGLDTPEFRALNPHERIPVLVDGDGPAIWESQAILRYLGARYGKAPFWPQDPLARAQVDQWAEWGKVGLQAGFARPIFWACVLTPAAERDEAALARAIDHFEGLLARLDTRLTGRSWVMGSDLTLADITIGHILFRYFDLGIARREFPAVRAYYGRLTARPAYRAHVMVDYSDLRAKGA